MAQPRVTAVRSGTTSRPTGERLRCGNGESVARPASAAVESPPRTPAQACAASWKQVEKRNAGYQNTSASNTAALTVFAMSWLHPSSAGGQSMSLGQREASRRPEVRQRGLRSILDRRPRA
jgi:hypothetical protein